MHKLWCETKFSFYPPKYPPTIAKTTCYSNLDLCCSDRCDSATPWVGQCRGSSAALPHLTDHWDQGGIYTFSSLPQRSSVLDRPFSLKCDQTAALSLPHSPLELLKLLPLIPFQIQESLSLQTALESSPIFSSSPRALGSRSSRWIVFVTLGACS
jgi:hypothetical protein